MCAMTGFFDALTRSSLVKAVDMSNDKSEVAAIDTITFVDSALHNLHSYQIDPKV